MIDRGHFENIGVIASGASYVHSGLHPRRGRRRDDPGRVYRANRSAIAMPAPHRIALRERRAADTGQILYGCVINHQLHDTLDIVTRLSHVGRRNGRWLAPSHRFAISRTQLGPD